MEEDNVKNKVISVFDDYFDVVKNSNTYITNSEILYLKERLRNNIDQMLPKKTKKTKKIINILSLF